MKDSDQCHLSLLVEHIIVKVKASSIVTSIRTTSATFENEWAVYGRGGSSYSFSSQPAIHTGPLRNRCYVGIWIRIKNQIKKLSESTHQGSAKETPLR